MVAALERAIARVHAEDRGCELYALHEGDGKLVMIEKWASQADLGGHSAGAAFRDLGGELDGALSAAPEIWVLAPHPAGTPAQGTL